MTTTPAPASALSRLAELDARIAKGEASEADFEKEMEALSLPKPPTPGARTRGKPRTYRQKGGQTPKTTPPGEPPARHKRPKYRALALAEVYDVGMQIENPEVRAIYFAQYLAAGRVSEILPLRADDVVDKEPTKDRTSALVLRIVTLKRKDNIQRVPSAVDVSPYDKMNRVVRAWRDRFKPDDALFLLTRQMVDYHMRKVTVHLTPRDDPSIKVPVKLHSHMLRAWRLSHLAQHHRFSTDELREFTQMKSPQTLAEYVSLEEEHLAERQMEQT